MYTIEHSGSHQAKLSQGHHTDLFKGRKMPLKMNFSVPYLGPNVDLSQVKVWVYGGVKNWFSTVYEKREIRLVAASQEEQLELSR